jgi:hypothetical protein
MFIDSGRVMSDYLTTTIVIYIYFSWKRITVSVVCVLQLMASYNLLNNQMTFIGYLPVNTVRVQYNSLVISQ